MFVVDPPTGEQRFARVKVPEVLPRFLALERGHRYVALEDVIADNLHRLFPGMEFTEHATFRVTRDADYDISEAAEDLLEAVEQELHARRFGDVVRLEVEATMSDEMRSVIVAALRVHPDHVYRARRPLDLADFFPLASLDRPDLHYRPWTPQTQPRLNADSQSVDMFAEIRRGDILVHHPYDAFSTSVERFIEQAVDDPDVLAIKHTIYRTSGDSPIVPALVRAAEQGKQAVAMVEVTARFDEERNIRWARSLERAGVHVVYGLAGLKTHCKLAHGRAPRGRRRAPLRPHRHRQLPPVDGAAVHRPRAVHVPRGRDRRRVRPVQPPHRLRPPAGATASYGWRRRSCASAWSTRSGAAASSTIPTIRRGWC